MYYLPCKQLSETRLMRITYSLSVLQSRFSRSFAASYSGPPMDIGHSHHGTKTNEMCVFGNSAFFSMMNSAFITLQKWTYILNNIDFCFLVVLILIKYIAHRKMHIKMQTKNSCHLAGQSIYFWPHGRNFLHMTWWCPCFSVVPEATYKSRVKGDGDKGVAKSNYTCFQTRFWVALQAI